MVDDPDEARLPECVRKWREYPLTRETLLRIIKMHQEDDVPGHALYQRIIDCLEWLATFPPAILLAASAADAEVLRAERAEFRDFYGIAYRSIVGETEEQCRELALARARILDASTHVCLPREALEELFDRWCRRMDTPQQVCADLRALLAREDGKGEG